MEPLGKEEGKGCGGGEGGKEGRDFIYLPTYLSILKERRREGWMDG